MNPKIGIVTVLYNSENVLTEYFESLSSQYFRDFVLIIVDNKSPDNSLEVSKRLANEACFSTIVIENDENYGVAKGNNIGIYKAKELGCEYILLSNNDVTLELNTITVLIDGIVNYKASMVVPKIYFHGSNIIWMAGGDFDKKSGINTHRGCFKEDKGEYNKDEEIGYAPTCFMLIHNSVFDRVGYMDENYFVYWDDTDFIYRALKKGQKLWYLPQSIVHHKEGTSTGVLSDFSIFYQNRNFVYFALKNYQRIYAIYVILFNLFYFGIVNFKRLTLKKHILRMKSFYKGIVLYNRIK